MKEGSTSSVSKQSHGATTLLTGTASTPSELDVMGNESVPSSFPLDTQQKMEVDCSPPIAGTSKSPVFKLGMLMLTQLIAYSLCIPIIFF